MTTSAQFGEWPEITDPRVREAFRRVDREAFVPHRLRNWSHCDSPLPIGEGQTISQPFVVALMTQALELEPGARVLEVGTGSGYQTAILCELTRQENQKLGASVYSVERFAGLSQRAAGVLEELGYAPHLRVGDGAEGWPEAAPFAAIMLTAAPHCLPRTLWQQLDDGGVMVAPVGPTPDEQILWRLRKTDGRMVAEEMSAVRFVPLISPLLNDPAMCIKIGRAGSR